MGFSALALDSGRGPLVPHHGRSCLLTALGEAAPGTEGDLEKSPPIKPGRIVRLPGTGTAFRLALTEKAACCFSEFLYVNILLVTY